MEILNFVLSLVILRIASGNPVKDETNLQQKNEKGRLFFDLDQWFDIFSTKSDCATDSNHNSQINENDSMTSSNSEINSNPTNPEDFYCKEVDFRLIAKCITMHCDRNVTCKELLMARSCVDRPEAINIENCIRDIRAEINRIEGPNNASKNMEKVRVKRFLFNELDQVLKLFFPCEDDDDEEDCQITSKAPSTTSTSTTAMSQFSSEPTSMTEPMENINVRYRPIFITMGTKIHSDQTQEYPDIDECKLESTDEDKGRCVKMKCENANMGNLDCVFVQITELCLDSMVPFECVITKISQICDEDDEKCLKNYKITFLLNLNEHQGGSGPKTKEKSVKTLQYIYPRLQLYDSTLGHLYSECKNEVTDLYQTNNLINCVLLKLEAYDVNPQGKLCIKALENRMNGKELLKEIHSCFPDAKS